MEKLHEGQKAAIYKELALKDILTGQEVPYLQCLQVAMRALN